jgi:hypothetical protein
MCGAMPPLPQYLFMVWCLFKHRDNFTFTFLTFYLYRSIDLFKTTKKSLGITRNSGEVRTWYPPYKSLERHRYTATPTGRYDDLSASEIPPPPPPRPYSVPSTPVATHILFCNFKKKKMSLSIFADVC